MEYADALGMHVGDKVIVKATREKTTIIDIQKIRDGYYPAVYFYCNDGERHYYRTVDPQAG